MRTATLVVGYVVVLVVVMQWEQVVRHRRRALVAAHTVALTVVVLTWLDLSQVPAAIVNGAWLVASLGWFALGGPAGRLRRRQRR